MGSDRIIGWSAAVKGVRLLPAPQTGPRGHIWWYLSIGGRRAGRVPSCAHGERKAACARAQGCAREGEARLLSLLLRSCRLTKSSRFEQKQAPASSGVPDASEPSSCASCVLLSSVLVVCSMPMASLAGSMPISMLSMCSMLNLSIVFVSMVVARVLRVASVAATPSRSAGHDAAGRASHAIDGEGQRRCSSGEEWEESNRH